MVIKSESVRLQRVNGQNRKAHNEFILGAKIYPGPNRTTRIILEMEIENRVLINNAK